MATTTYSHAFLVGSFNEGIKPKQLRTDKRWKRIILSKDDYDDLCTMYYQSHIDAMTETNKRSWCQKHKRKIAGCMRMAKGIHFKSVSNKIKQWILESKGDKNKDRFLRNVRHYQYCIEKGKGKEVEFSTTGNGHYYFYPYKLNICSLHLYLFPLGIAMFAIEIDDTGSELKWFTYAHNLLRIWAWNGKERFSDSMRSELDKIMEPLSLLLPNNDMANLISDGNKLKMFQVVKVDSDKLFTDNTLYEISTSSPIGAVGSKGVFDPDPHYYNTIMKNNVVAAFNNWKGLSLVDSFTIIGKEFNEWTFINLYFGLIYMRSLFEKDFCFSRNNMYRLNKSNGNLLMEISLMEKYYFYETISHNFLPNLLYQSMSKGLGIKEEREQLANQIKDKEETNNNRILATVSVFAVFSIAYDSYSILKTWLHNNIHWYDRPFFNWMAMLKLNNSEEMPFLAIILTLIALAVSMYLVGRIYKRRKV